MHTQHIDRQVLGRAIIPVIIRLLRGDTLWPAY